MKSESNVNSNFLSYIINMCFSSVFYVIKTYPISLNFVLFKDIFLCIISFFYSKTSSIKLLYSCINALVYKFSIYTFSFTFNLKTLRFLQATNILLWIIEKQVAL
jgi:hypothetical protein